MKTDLSLRTAEDQLIGLHENMPNETYHTGPGYSASDLVTMSEGFDLWKWKKGQPKEPSDDMVLGSATHLLLEARLKNDVRLFLDGIAVLPRPPEGALVTGDDLKAKCKELGLPVKGTKAELTEKLRAAQPNLLFWSDVEKEFEQTSKSKLILSPEERELAERMVDAVMREPEAVGYLQHGMSEPSIFARHPETGLLLKCRPDYLRPADGLSINFKTVRPNVSFEKQAADMAYDWSSAFYCDVLAQHFGRSFDEIHISVTKAKEGPCRVSIDTIDDDDLAFARAQYSGLLARIPECEANGIWPAPPVTLKTARIPNYSRRVNPYGN